MDQVEYQAGSTALAMSVGEMRERVSRLKEELARAETDLRATDEKDRGELSGVDQRQQATLDTLSRSVSALTERVAALETKSAAKPTPPPPPLPKRNDGESSDAYRNRVSAWARQQGRPEPPKPGAFDNGPGYADKVARHYGAK